MNRKNWRDFEMKFSDPDGIRTEQLLTNVIRNSLNSSKGRLTISLSSGIDSTLCLGLTRKVFPDRKITAISAVYEGKDESKKAKEIARKFNTDFKTVRINSIFTNMPELIMITGKPKWNTYQHIIAKEAKKYSKIMITGDGADEIFAGYVFRYNKFLNLTKINTTRLNKIKNYLQCHNRDWVPDQKSIFGKNITFSWKKIHNYFKPYFSNSLPLLKQVMFADFNGKLCYDFIPSGNSIFSRYELIGFQPFLQKEIIDYGLKLPINELYDNISVRGKLILRNIAKRINVEHIDEKRGFSLNLILDWQNNGRHVCKNYLLDKNSHIYKNKIINYNWIKKAFEVIENDGDVLYLNRLISILALEVWYRLQTKELKTGDLLVK
jgi:asparagine synthase (glutamine-hydrolysing)